MEAIQTLRETVLRDVRRLPDQPLRPCAGLVKGERCDGERHHPLEYDRHAGRPCPLRFYRRALVTQKQALDKLRPELLRIGWSGDAEGSDIGAAILRAVDQGLDAERIGDAGVSGLRPALAAVKTMIAQPPERCGHLWLLGTSGTAKTMMLLGLRFVWLRRGIDSRFITGEMVREVARQYNGGPAEREIAETTIAGWAKARAIFLDDLCDRRADVGDKPAGEGGAAAVLLNLAAAFGGLFCGSSNLQQDELADHQDCGARLVSRLFADREGLPAHAMKLEGRDQRARAGKESQRRGV